MELKGNKIENWDTQYKDLETTYTEKPSNAPDLVNYLGFNYVWEDVKKYIADPKKAEILEVGCGGARNSLFLALKGYKVTCSDFSPGAIRLAKDNFAANNASGTFVQDDFLNTKLQKGHYDCIMSFGLLEHFEKLEPVIGSITNLLKPGGIQIHIVITKKFSTQTIMHLLLYPYTFLKNTLKGDFENIFKKSFRDFPHYENTFSYNEYCKVFENEGNELIKCQPQGIIYPFIALTPIVGKIVVKIFTNLLAKMIVLTDSTQSSILHLFSPTFYIVTRKRG